MREWQRLEQHAVDDAEDRAVGADAEREREDRDERERADSWRACEGVANVLAELVEPIVAGVSRCRHVATPGMVKNQQESIVSAARRGDGKNSVRPGGRSLEVKRSLRSLESSARCARWNQALAALAGIKRSLRSLDQALAALAAWSQVGGCAALVPPTSARDAPSADSQRAKRA